MNATRPDPDALLFKLQREEAAQTRARLKIFFGFAPGVGKTYAMLASAQRLQAQGRSVLVGCVETHGRAETASLTHGLTLVPPLQVNHRGAVLRALDVDAIIERRPGIVLVDELAHTNAPGSRHLKRWQDVFDLLDAGIEVHTTLNVQHIASLNDVIAQITHVVVRETVPDSVLERADEIELVDISPEELLQRLREGKVYMPALAERAAAHFFKRGNLLALRELALRRAAERVDSDIRAYRSAEGIESAWQTGERILVCVSSGPGSEKLVRAARRIAAGLRAPWSAVFVETPTTQALSADDRQRLEGHIRLAEALGATTARLSGATVAEAVLDYARHSNVTRIVLGKPVRGRARAFFSGTVVDAVVRQSGNIDVLVTSGDDPEATPRARAKVAEPARWTHYLYSAAAIAAVTGLGFLTRSLFALADVVMLYLLAITFVATVFGRAPSLLASALSVAAYDFFFVPPFYTFATSDTRHTLTFVVMFGVGIALSNFTLRLRRQEQWARAREQRTRAVYALAQELALALSDRQVARVGCSAIARSLGRPCVVYLRAGQSEELEAVAFLGIEATEPRELGVAQWVFAHDRPAGAGTDTLPGARFCCFPLSVGIQTHGTLAIEARDAGPLDSDQRQFVEAAARQIALALERWLLADEAGRAEVQVKTEELRSTLLSSISHDLRTPLATITGSASALLHPGLQVPAAEQRELLAMIHDEAERLERVVSNLLIMTQLESGAIRTVGEWLPVEEVIGSALNRAGRFISAARFHTEVAANLPLVRGDPILLEQLLVNLFENAAKYAPPATPIVVRAVREDDQIVVSVIDRGPGFPVGAETKVFDKFYRAAGAHGRGVGLGLAIVKAIAVLHGGSVQARNDGGAIVALRLPVATDAPLGTALN